MLKIFIAGGTGMLGTNLSQYLRNLQYNVIAHGYKHEADVKSDMTKSETAISLLDKIDPDIIVNLICLSDVEKNEKDQDLAYQLNVKPVENISHWIQLRKTDVKFIQISTDHLYDNEGLNVEEDVLCRNTYATTKYCAEKIALNVDASVLRTNFFGKSQNKNRETISDWIELNVENKTPIKLFNDVYFSPLSIGTLMKMILHVMKNFKSGVYNLGSRDGMSKAEFAYKLGVPLDRESSFSTEVSVEDVGFYAIRPKGMMMDVSRFEKSFGVILPTLESEINTHLRGINR